MVIEVEEWGKLPTVNDLKNDLSYYEDILLIYRKKNVQIQTKD